MSEKEYIYDDDGEEKETALIYYCQALSFPLTTLLIFPL